MRYTSTPLHTMKITCRKGREKKPPPDHQYLCISIYVQYNIYINNKNNDNSILNTYHIDYTRYRFSKRHGRDKNAVAVSRHSLVSDSHSEVVILHQMTTFKRVYIIL